MPGLGLQAENLACERGDKQLFSELSFELLAQEALWVEGPNGRGKTCLLRLLAGLEVPDAGQVRWNGQALSTVKSAWRTKMHYLGHQLGIKSSLSPFENLQFDLKLTVADPAEILAALSTWGLKKQAHISVGLLSAGQQRRVALARLALSSAILWILDEPLTALDREASQQLEQLLLQHLQRNGLLIFTNHQERLLTQYPLRQLSLHHD